jgi:nucleoside-diphosphate-sugar epimerase
MDPPYGISASIINGILRIRYSLVVVSTRVLVTGGSGFIGIHLVKMLHSRGYRVLNLDVQAPIDGRHLDLWVNCSILNLEIMQGLVADFSPEAIIHLAAVTTQNAKNINEFEVNLLGTENLIKVANELCDFQKFIFASTQYVNTPGLSLTSTEQPSKPYGFYGESKVLGELMLKSKLIKPNWTIIRPTTIWGPWHSILIDGLWKQIANGRYFHPANDRAVKCYGYVENTAWQIVRLLELSQDETACKVFYLGDENLLQSNWVGLFVSKLNGKEMREIPKFLLFVLSEFGEWLGKFGIKFPIYRSRYRNLLTTNPSPIDDTLKLLGPSPIGLEAAVEETCVWLKQFYSTRMRVS